MIIRYGGGNAGIKEYLENGRKVDRHFTRDEMDKRVTLDGDINVMQAVVDSIDDHGQERYLHLSMSFNEPGVSEEVINKAYQDFKRELMSAYRDDEYCMYAEIHWPKIKEAYNHQTEQMEPRYPHLHIVIPKRNLETGGFLDPVSLHSRNVKYFDAIQEKVNRDNGLSSPRNSPRIGTNHYEAALGRYKDKEFTTKNGEVKRQIYNALLTRDIRTVKDYKALVAEFGEVKTRNAGKDNEYLAVRVGDDKKFTNLKANIFASEFIENRALTLEPLSDAQVARRVDTWRNIKSLEIKYINNASEKVKSTYRGLSPSERRDYLVELEKFHDERIRQAKPADSKRSRLSGLSAGDNQPGHSQFAGRPTPEKRHLQELRESHVAHFGSPEERATRLFLHSHANDDVLDVQSDRDSGLRPNIYAGTRIGILTPEVDPFDPQSSVVSSLLAAEADKAAQQNDLAKFAEIRKNLDPQHLLAFVQLRYGVDPEQHPISKARDGSPRINAGKVNLNVSDFLTKHIGLEWNEASEVLLDLYDQQQRGIVGRPKTKAELTDDWRRFRDEHYPKSVRSYSELKNEIKVSYSLGLKAINSEYFARRKSITNDVTLTRTDKHYMRSVVILEKLQKLEDLQQTVKEQKQITVRAKYPYSTLFYDYATKNEEISMKALENLKRHFQPNAQEGENSIGSTHKILTPHHMPDGVEAAKRARLVAKLQQKDRELQELKIRMSDLRPKPLPTGAVAFTHKDHGKQIFVNHPDRVELNRVTEPDEVAVAMGYAIERFGSPLDIKGTPEFKAQVIAVAAERDLDITFTDEGLNQALQAKREELGMTPLQSNEVAAPSLELDTSLPVAAAADKALLASKVAELEAVNQAERASPSPLDLEIRQATLSDAQQRHEEIQTGFVDDGRVTEIAQADNEAWTYLAGRPEQQQLALSMATAMENGTYRQFMDTQGPAELQLTIDAAKVVQSNEATPAPAEPVQAAAATPAPVEAVQPAAATPAPVEAVQPAAASPAPAEPVQAAAATPAPVEPVQPAGFNEQELRRELYYEWVRDRVANLEARQLQGYRPTVADTSTIFSYGVQEREEWIEQQLDQRRQIANTTPVVSAASAPTSPSPAAPEPLTFTQDGQPATLNLERQQAEPVTVERLQYEISEYRKIELDEVGQLEELQAERDDFAPDRTEDQEAELDARIAASLGRLEVATSGRERAEAELAVLAPELVERKPEVMPPLPEFTHNGQPATLDTTRFQQQPEAAVVAQDDTRTLILADEATGRVWDGTAFADTQAPEAAQRYTPVEGLNKAFELQISESAELNGSPVEIQRYAADLDASHRVTSTEHVNVWPIAEQRFNEHFGVQLDRQDYLQMRDGAAERVAAQQPMERSPTPTPAPSPAPTQVPAAAPRPVLSPENRSQLEAEWTALNTKALKDREQIAATFKTHFKEELVNRQAELKTEAAENMSQQPLKERLLATIGIKPMDDNYFQQSGIKYALEAVNAKSDRGLSDYDGAIAAANGDSRSDIEAGRSTALVAGLGSRDEYVQKQAQTRLDANGTLAPRAPIEAVQIDYQAHAKAMVDKAASDPQLGKALGITAVNHLHSMQLGLSVPQLDRERQVDPQDNDKAMRVELRSDLFHSSAQEQGIDQARQSIGTETEVQWAQADAGDIAGIKNQELAERSIRTVETNAQVLPVYAAEMAKHELEQRPTITPAELDKELRKEQDFPTLAMDVPERVQHFEAVREAYANAPADGPAAARREVIVQAMEMRHAELAGNSDPQHSRDAAREDLAVLTLLEGKPEEPRALAAMGAMMDNQAYGDYVRTYGPSDFETSVEASRQIIEQDATPSAPERGRDNTNMDY